MLTRFISDKSYETVAVEYPHDSNVGIENSRIGVDGNLEYTITPILSNVKDLKINNYVLNILSKNDKISNIIDTEENNKINNKLCRIYHNYENIIDEKADFWKFETNHISLSTPYTLYDYDNIFEIDFIDDFTCRIHHDVNFLKYTLAYSLALSTVKFVPLTANNIENYTFDLNYSLNENKIIFYVRHNLSNFAIKLSGSKLYITSTASFDDSNFFFINRISDLNEIRNMNNWSSYYSEYAFNRNDLNIDLRRSIFDVSNNFLLTTTINSISSSLPINILTLKNQLNQENDQSRGNVFLNENETNLKEYESIFTGGYRESGYEKINLGYTSYSTPFVFKSGKTTYFHMPHDIYPYEKLNVNSSKLVESGAIGGNNPLNSDKIWKKLRDYRDTSPYSDPHEEQTGQWLCTWLSAGNPYTKPIWMDRYYKPDKITSFEALSANVNEAIYIDSFNCLDLKENVSDVRSSLTFEKGSYYAYMHLGKNDYLNLITESISAKIHHNKMDEYKETNFKDLQDIDGAYSFDGKSFGYIESNKKFEHNVASFSFFLEKKDWEIPSGNMIFGNYINKGFGFYNYILNTPYSILKYDNNTLHVLNNNYLKIDKLSTENITLCGIAGISRRGGFDNIHIITNDFKLIEIDLKGTIVDSNSTLINTLSLKSSDKIYSITNDENYCYVHASSGVAKIDLNSNLISNADIKYTISTSYSGHSIVVDDEGLIYKFHAKQPIYRDNNIYGLSGKNLLSYSTSLSTLSTYIQTKGNIACYNIDSDSSINIVSDNELYLYDANILKNTIKLPVLSTYSLSAEVFNFCEKFEYGKLKKYKHIYCSDKNTGDSYVLEIDDNNLQNLIKLNDKYSKIQDNLDFTGYNYNRGYLSQQYTSKTYVFKVKLANRVNDEDFTELSFVIKGNDLATGKRHFLFTIDCYNGEGYFYLDGELYDTLYFESKKYTLSKTFNGRIYYGANPYHNGTTAFKYFKNISEFTYSDAKISDIYIINKALNRFETLYFYNLIHPSNDLVYNVPSGTRSFIDKIEKTFNFNIPMFKSNYFNLKILNTGIAYDEIKLKMEDEIRRKIHEYLPNYTKINNFEWLDSLNKKIIIEGDYNVSNTLTDII